MAGAGLLTEHDLLEALKTAALNAGFVAAGGVDLAPAWQLYQDQVKLYDAWLERGNAGEMQYLVRGRDRRADPRLVFPETQSIFCVLLPYRKRPAGQLDPRVGPRYARYLDGDDYHERLSIRLDAILRETAGKNQSMGLSWKVCVDTSAVLERTWAALCGLGWIGKNSMLIHPQEGSYTFIGVALLNRSLHSNPKVLPDYCGNCSRCLQGCPTNAIEPNRSVDSRRCIAYLTLEKRGSLELTPEQERAMGTWIAGCDLCQEVCPFNSKPVRREIATEGTAPTSAIALDRWELLERESETEYRNRVRSSALARVKPAMFRRNLELTRRNALTLGSGDEQMTPTQQTTPLPPRSIK
ncbi:MAG: tRNA epoxyqueuosine(34) reductase QueG [Pseudomonadota bacterium]